MQEANPDVSDLLEDLASNTVENIAGLYYKNMKMEGKFRTKNGIAESTFISIADLDLLEARFIIYKDGNIQILKRNDGGLPLYNIIMESPISDPNLHNRVVESLRKEFRGN